MLPDPIEFALSPDYLGRSLYPRQGTFLKLVFLRTDLMTDYDVEVINEWIQLWKESGDEGVLPDIWERMETCKAEGRPWFKDTLAIIGRRGSKGFLGGVSAAYVLWRYLALGNPQYHYGLDQDRHLAMFVFAAKKELAVKLQWADVANTITSGACFHPYLTTKPMTADLHLYTPFDFVRIADRHSAGVAIRDVDMASIEVSPKESTKVSARGPALFGFLMDEMAHVTKEVARASADDLWDSALPATATFRTDAWIYEASSPEAKTGQFYANSVEAQRIADRFDEVQAGTAARPEILVVQLPSFALYKDWERAHEIPLRPGDDRCFPRQRQAVQVYDEQMRRFERQNPDRFRVEFLSKWKSVADAYLHAEPVEAAFKPWPDAEHPLNPPTNLMQGTLANDYVMHIDPSKVGDNTGLCIAHAVPVAGSAIPHVIGDVIGHWEPGDFPENGMEIDYQFILNEIAEYIRRFVPSQVSFDQGPSSGFMIQKLRSWVAVSGLPKRVTIMERTATAPYNWQVAETTKVALQVGAIHLPYDPPDELLRNEMLFLQLVAAKKVDHPSTGPVRSRDVFDALSNVVHALIGTQVAAAMGDQVMASGVVASHPGGFPLAMDTPANRPDSPNRRPLADVVSQMQAFQRQAGAYSAGNRLRSGRPSGEGFRGGRAVPRRPPREY